MVIMPATDSTTVTTTEVESVTCDCCGLMEECTPAYIDKIRQRFHGNWICGLCGEAVKDEIARSERRISTEEAMASHMSFCRGASNGSPVVHYISAVRTILRRRVGSPGPVRSVPNSPLRSVNSVRISRSESCLTELTLELQEMMKG